jgi:hypothetical protein
MPPRTQHPLSSRYRSQTVARVPESHNAPKSVFLRVETLGKSVEIRVEQVAVDR